MCIYMHQLFVYMYQLCICKSAVCLHVSCSLSGFDALAQAMLCKELVGWRGNDVRKVIIMIGDEESKYAMDGIIAGIVRPFNETCLTFEKKYYDNTYTYYTEQLRYDYPSFGQIRKLRENTQTDIIFLSTKKKLQWFKDASKFIQNTEKNVADFTSGGNVEEIIGQVSH